jgi:esterase/lipase
VLSLNRRGTKGEIKKTEKTLLLPKEIRRQATAIYEVLMYKIGKATKKEISLITHSIGGPNALVAILMVKEEMPTAKINVTIINSAGTIGKDSVFKLAGRFAEKMRNKQNQKTLSSATKKIAYLKNPLQANNELIGMTGFQIDALMRELRKMGVGISVIHSENDRMLPADRVKENLNSEHADEIHFMEGTHNQLYHDPEKYVAKAEEMLSTLEASQGGNFNIKV